MGNRKYEAFTLIEMLVVMGILIILMVIGIAAGRFALFRAADVAHRNAADQLYEGLQAYYVDNRAFPKIDSCGELGNEACTPALLMTEDDKLKEYMDIGAFNGGSGATFFYFAGGDNFDQAVLICVSMRGIKSANDGHGEGAYYCSGNAFNTQITPQLAGLQIDRNLIEADTEDPLWNAFVAHTPTNGSEWDDQEWK